MKLRLKVWRRDNGNATVEFALCIPALIILAFGAFQVLSMIQINQQMSSIARQAAKVGFSCDDAEADDTCFSSNIYGNVDRLIPGAIVLLSIYERAGAAGNITRTRVYTSEAADHHDASRSRYNYQGNPAAIQTKLREKFTSLDGVTIKKIAVVEVFYSRNELDLFRFMQGNYYEVAIF